MPPKKSNSKQAAWGDAQTNECIKHFNTFYLTGSEDGWDPENTQPSYIVGCVKDSLKIKPYLSKYNGGHKNNKDNQKAIRGYKRAACEFWVKLAKRRIRLGTS
jgi:hypothetical protein